MDYLNQKKGFLGYEANPKIDNNVIVVPFGLEKSVSYGGGTKKGPLEIIKASHQVELYDEDLNKEPYKTIGIKTLKPFVINALIIFFRSKGNQKSPNYIINFQSFKVINYFKKMLHFFYSDTAYSRQSLLINF